MTTWHSRGYLPHIDGINLIQHITFHLADSLPRDAIGRMERMLEHVPNGQQEQERRQQIQDLLDAGSGSCLLRHDQYAEIVQDSLLHGDGGRYRLIAWVIMPNHIHAMIQMAEFPLAKIIQSWKRHSSSKILGILKTHEGFAGSRTLWHRDYWDRYMRDDRHMQITKTYIEENPVKAGLVAKTSDWKWSSANFSGATSDNWIATGRLKSAIPGKAPRPESTP
jgi:type I restriction enzyme R subunit/putative DNA methylase